LSWNNSSGSATVIGDLDLLVIANEVVSLADEAALVC
jgi:hypothetical protein